MSRRKEFAAHKGGRERGDGAGRTLSVPLIEPLPSFIIPVVVTLRHVLFFHAYNWRTLFTGSTLYRTCVLNDAIEHRSD